MWIANDKLFHAHVNAQQYIRRTFVLRRKYGENFLDLTSTDLSSLRFILFDWLHSSFHFLFYVDF